MENQAVVSIIVRTCGRPHILKYTLDSLVNQRYKNFEVVVIEDGENLAEALVTQYISKLNLRYKATGVRVGRAAAGNIGLSLTKGAFLNFLDDDDLFYPNHIDTLVHALETSGVNAAYTVANECITKKRTTEPYFWLIRKKIRFNQPFNRLLLTNKNYLPIQTVMFSRALYENYGGFDETLDQLEDWDLWVRYAMRESFIFINQVTSEYKVPSTGYISYKRNRELFSAYNKVTTKFKKYIISMNAYESGLEIEYLLSEYRVSRIKKILRSLKKRILYN